MKYKLTEDDIKAFYSTKQRKTLGPTNNTISIPSMQLRYSAIDDDILNKKGVIVNLRKELYSLNRQSFDVTKEVDMFSYNVKELESNYSKVAKAQIAMLEEDRAVLLRENKNLSEERSAVGYRVISAKNIVELSETDIENLRIALKEKQEEIAKYLESKEELEEQLKGLLEREQRFLEEDRITELAIQQMKGRLYTILLLTDKEKTHCRRYGEVFEALIPSKIDSWVKLKFDQAICTEDIFLAQCWVELSIGVIEKVLEYSITTNSNERASIEKLPKEITLFVLSLHNKYTVVEEYLVDIIKSLPETFSNRMEACVYSLSEDVHAEPLRLGKISITDISNCIKIVKEEQSKSKRGNNYALEIILGEFNAILKFVFVNTEDEKNLEEIQRRARDIHQTRQSNRKYTSKGYDALMQEVLMNVRMGYLIVLCEDDDKSLYCLLQAAKTLSVCITTI